MPLSESSELSRRSGRDCHRHRCRDRDDYYYYEYEYGPNPLALYYLTRPYGGYFGGYGGYGAYGFPGYGLGRYGPGLRGYGPW